MSRLGSSALVVGMSLLATACGRKGPLSYPDMLVLAAPTAVTAQQSGSYIKLQFALPDKNRGGQSIKGVAGVKISRRVMEADQEVVCRSCMTDYSLFLTLYLDSLPTNSQRYGDSLIVVDSHVSVGKVYSYSVVPFTADGVEGASSMHKEVRVSPPHVAPVLKIESLPTEVKLQIAAPLSLSGRLLGYNLYRSSAPWVASYRSLNNAPLKDTVYVDSALERGVKYRYSVKALIVQESGSVAESEASQAVEGMLKDDE